MIDRVARSVLLTLALAGAGFVACQVYDPSLLTGGAGSTGRGTGGVGAVAGTGGFAGGGSGTGGSSLSGGSGGSVSGAPGTAGSMGFEAGAGGEGEEPAGGTGGAGGTSGGAGGKGGTGGASGGAGGKGGASGAGGMGGTPSGGTGGAAGTPAAGGAGMGGAGGAGTGSGGAGTGGAGTGGMNGGAGSGGSSPTEVELTGTATADSSEATTSQMHPASHGNDGDLATRWCAADGAVNHYWTLDLGAVHEVTRLEIVWEYPAAATGYPYRYRVDVSSDGTTFTPSIDKTANAETTAMQTASFPAGTMARHVRIVVTGLRTNVWASFWEASVYGY